MIQHDKLTDIENMTVRVFIDELTRTGENLDDGIKAGHAIELIAVALKIEKCGQDVRKSLERWLQLDLWDSIPEENTTDSIDS